MRVTARTALGPPTEVDLEDGDDVAALGLRVSELLGVPPLLQQLATPAVRMAPWDLADLYHLGESTRVEWRPVDTHTVEVVVYSSLLGPLSVAAAPGDSMDGVLARLRAKHAIAPDARLYRLRGERLQGSTTVSELSGVPVFLALVTRPVPIRVKVNEDTVQLVMEQGDHVQHLRQHIYVVTGRQPEDWTLLYKGRVLEDGESLQACGIKAGSSLQLKLQPSKDSRRVDCVVVLPTGNLMTVGPLTLPVSAIRSQVAQASNMALGSFELGFRGMQLSETKALNHYDVEPNLVLYALLTSGAVPTTIHLPRDYTVQMPLAGHYNIKFLKWMVTDHTGIIPDRQLVQVGGQQVSDLTTLALCGATGGRSRISVAFNLSLGISITAHTPSGRAYTLVVEPFFTVQCIRYIVALYMKLPIGVLGVEYQGQLLVLLHKLSHYGITGGSSVRIVRADGSDTDGKRRISVRGEGDATVAVKLLRGDRVLDVASRVVQRGFAAGQLFRGAMEITSDAVLADYAVGTRLAVDVLVPGQQGHIYVRTLRGDVVAVEAKYSDLVQTIKSRLARQEGIPESLQRLVVDGRLMEDRHELDEYREAATGVVYMEQCVRGG